LSIYLKKGAAMREIRRFELDADLCVARRVVSACALEVEAGRVWLTIDRDGTDYWLAPGECMALARGQRIWLSAESGGARLKVVDLRPARATKTLRSLGGWAPRGSGSLC
jgi:hypothetical protein